MGRIRAGESRAYGDCEAPATTGRPTTCSERRTFMGTKTGILIGVGIGYVLGTRAGRERYEQIRANASKLRRFPIVARPLDAAGQKMSDIVRAGGEQVTDKVADAVKERLFGAPASQPTTVDAQATSSTTQR